MSVTGPRLLVVGGTGFIGYQLIALAKSKNWDVTSVSLNPPLATRTIEGVNYLFCDINEISCIRHSLTEEFDYVVNLGGYVDHAMFSSGGCDVLQTHFVGLVNLVEIVSSKNLVQVWSLKIFFSLIQNEPLH